MEYTIDPDYLLYKYSGILLHLYFSVWTLFIVGEKLVEVEKLQLQKHHQDLKNDAKSVEAKMLMYQRKYEAQKQAELQAQVSVKSFHYCVL